MKERKKEKKKKREKSKKERQKQGTKQKEKKEEKTERKEERKCSHREVQLGQSSDSVRQHEDNGQRALCRDWVGADLSRNNRRPPSMI